MLTFRDGSSKERDCRNARYILVWASESCDMFDIRSNLETTGGVKCREKQGPQWRILAHVDMHDASL